MPRLALWERPVSYAAIGATKADDLLQYPPAGYRPVERRARIGHGDARFAYACSATLSWGIQRNAGFEVRVSEAPPEVTDQTYIPVSFDTAGTPVVPASGGGEAVYGPEGTAFVVPGDTVELIIRLGPIGVPAPVRVVYVINEKSRKGFAYGTLPGHPEDGEESFMVEKAGDGSVWLTIRAFSRPSTWYWWLVYPVLRLVQDFYTRRYLRTLSGPLG
jgi:uncharacterized protein (UPF0548 family)